MFIQAVLILHLLICLALIGAILLQRSEGGGALGMGGGPSSMMSGRSAANFMTRTTTLLGAAFLVTSVTLTIMNKSATKPADSLMQDGRTKDGIPTKGIDLSVPAAPANAIAPVPAAPAGGIPASAPSAPQPAPLFPATPAAPAPEPTPAEKK